MSSTEHTPPEGTPPPAPSTAPQALSPAQACTPVAVDAGHESAAAPSEAPSADLSAPLAMATAEPTAKAAETDATAEPQTQTPAQGPAPLSPAACAQELKQRWPALFGGAPKPLKLRIHVDIQAQAPGAFSRQTLTAFFRRHTGSTSYLMAMSKGQQRFDLEGQPSGEVTEENRQLARDELTRRGVQLQSRRAAQAQQATQQAEQQALEAQQRRNRAGLLRDFDTTTLTRANFCALKGVEDAELDGLLAIAREEAKQQREAPARHPDQRDQRGPREPRDARGNPPRRNANGPRGQTPAGAPSRPPRPPRGPSQS